jgi:hypothetical protein
MLPDTNQSRTGRRFLKRSLYSMLTLMDVFKIIFGKAQPKINFTVKAEPASVYYNFRVRPDKLNEFIDYINLPEGFSVCPIHCIDGEQADYLLTANVYEVTGVAVGIRIEYSTYIRDAEGVPRYMVLEAQSSEYSMDPIDIITQKGRVEHDTSNNQTRSVWASLEGALFQAHYEKSESMETASIHQEWVKANDFIYWRVGICDRTFYDAGLANPRALLIDPTTVSVDDQTHWAPFLEPEPKHVIEFQDAIDFVIMPWVNI